MRRVRLVFRLLGIQRILLRHGLDEIVAMTHLYSLIRCHQKCRMSQMVMPCQSATVLIQRVQKLLKILNPVTAGTLQLTLVTGSNPNLSFPALIFLVC